MKNIIITLLLVITTVLSSNAQLTPASGKNYYFVKNGCNLEVYFDGKIHKSFDLTSLQWTETTIANTTHLSIFDENTTFKFRNLDIAVYNPTSQAAELLINDLVSWKNLCDASYYLDSLLTLLNTIPFDTTQIDTNDLTPVIDSLGVIISEVIDVYDLINSIPFDTSQVDTNDLTPVTDSLGVVISEVIDVYDLINSIPFDTSQVDTNDLTPVLDSLGSIANKLNNLDDTNLELIDSLVVIINLLDVLSSIPFDTSQVDTNDLTPIINALQVIESSFSDTLTTKGCVFANDHDKISGAAVLNYPGNTLHSITFSVINGSVSVLMNAKTFTYNQGEVVSFTANACQYLPNAITFTTVGVGDIVNIITLE